MLSNLIITPNPVPWLNVSLTFTDRSWNLWIPIDAANRGFITSLKITFGESINYETAESVSPSNNKVLPVNFSKENKSMVSHLANLFNTHKVAIPEKFDKLLISLKTAIVNEYSLDKEQSSYTDLFDALRLSLRMYKIQ